MNKRGQLPYYIVQAWANCVAYLGGWAMREPGMRDKQEQIPAPFLYIDLAFVTAESGEIYRHRYFLL